MGTQKSLYLAGGRRRVEWIQEIGEKLEDVYGYNILYWQHSVLAHEAWKAAGARLRSEHTHVRMMGVTDIAYVSAADGVVAFLDDAGRSTFVEVGIAYAMHRPLVLISDAPLPDQPALIQGIVHHPARRRMVNFCKGSSIPEDQADRIHAALAGVCRAGDF